MSTDGATKDRLIAAASSLFAERGFHGTTARDIAERAGVNLAAGHYHFGSKKALYVAALREHFARTRAQLAERDALKSPRELARMSRTELEALLHRYIQGLLDFIIGSPKNPHGGLLQREMTDPSEALPLIVEEFITPMHRAMERLVARLVPTLRPAEIERCVIGIFGQVVFYRFAMPFLLALLGGRVEAPGFTREVAEHIVEFSLGGMKQIARQRPRRRRATPSR